MCCLCVTLQLHDTGMVASATMTMAALAEHARGLQYATEVGDRAICIRMYVHETKA